MIGMMTYKGYDGIIQYSPEDRIFFGVVQGISDKITFEGESVQELEEDFHAAVDDYLAFCQKVGKSPDKVYRGSFNVRISPELHKKACQLARRRNVSLNQFVEEAIRSQVQSDNIYINNISISSSERWINNNATDYEHYSPQKNNILNFSYHESSKSENIQEM